MKKIRKNIIIFIMAFLMAFLSVPFGNTEVQAKALDAKTGYHIVYHNNHEWSQWGAHIANCDNYSTDSVTRMCYHFLRGEIISNSLYPSVGPEGDKRHDWSTDEEWSVDLPAYGGGTWTVTGEHLYARTVNGQLEKSSTKFPDTSFAAFKDVRVYKFVSSLPACDSGVNGKYIRGTAYYRWMSNTGEKYGLHKETWEGKWSNAVAYKVPGNSEYYHYFMGKENLSGEQLNGNNEYPSFDSAINGVRSYGFLYYDANGNPVFGDNWEGFVWDKHTHVAYRYICDGHYEPNTYTVRYNGNGNSGGATQSSSHTYDAAKNLNTNGFTKDNYEFAGWSTNASSNTVEYIDGQSVSNLTASDGGTVDLYAVWTPKKYDVTVVDQVENGGELGRKTISASYDDTVYGSAIGDSTADNAYYYGYYYSSCTNAKVTGSNVTVYRYFKRRTIDIAGSVNWNDKSNYYNSRPDSSTVRIYRDGAEVWNSTLVANEDNIPYTAQNLPKYSTTDGHEFVYTASQDTVVSKNADDKYTTTQEGFIFNNNLENNGKFSVAGSIKWVDNSNEGGFRPETVDIALFRNGTEIGSQELTAIDTGYSFVNLDKFDSSLNPYTYTAQETLYSKVLAVVNGKFELVDAYQISVDGLNFTNTLINRSYVKPDAPNDLDMKLHFTDCDWGYIQVKPEDVVIPCELKRIESKIVDNGTVVYGEKYDGFSEHVILTEVWEKISSIPAGKYEICINDDRFIINDITLNNGNGVSLVEENGKTYVVITERESVCEGQIIVDVTHKKHIGYQTHADIQNFFKAPLGAIKTFMLQSMFSDDIVVPDPEEFTISYYMNDKLVTEETYLETTEAVINGCSVNGFIGWAKEKNGDPVYIEGDSIEMLKDLELYAVISNAKSSVSGNSTSRQ